MSYLRCLKLSSLPALLSIVVVIHCLTSPTTTAQPYGTTGIGYMYPFGFFNISTDAADTGFLQVFACDGQRATNMYLALTQASFNTRYVVSDNSFFNKTILYDQITVTETVKKGFDDNPYGFLVTSDAKINVYAVKADRGTTDGYYIFPLTKNSREFYVANWLTSPLVNGSFAGLTMTSAFNDTCIEIYAINGTRYRRISTQYLSENKMNAVYLVGSHEDTTTGMYVNSSKPIGLTAGVSCGSVTVDPYIRYCDHMAEQIPPAAELGTAHIVPPIPGRSTRAGYIVRVVATQSNTTVTWSSSSAVSPAGPSTVLDQGRFIQLNVVMTSAPLSVVCSKPCVVMQYNKGVQAAKPESSFTDPFMMLTTPTDHFSPRTCFETPSMSMINKALVDFSNYLTVVARTSEIASILYDGMALTGLTFPGQTSVTIGSYTVFTGQVTPGAHRLSTASGTVLFGAYLVGHSSISTTTSAYGFGLTYEMFGQPIGNWVVPTDAVPPSSGNSSTGPVAGTCHQDSVRTGSAVVNDSQAIYHTFALSVNVINGEPLTERCIKAYIDSFKLLVADVFGIINQRICSRLMCSYLQDNVTSGGILISPGDAAAGIDEIRLFVALDATSLDYSVTLDSLNNVPTSLQINVPYVGIADTNINSFARCRREVREYVTPFVTWFRSSGNSTASLTTEQQSLLINRQLLTPPPNCPAITFDSSSFKTSAQAVCLS